MTNQRYEDFNPEEETTLREACYLYGDPAIVANARDLERDGFDTNGVTVISGDWRDRMFDQHRRAMAKLRNNVKEMILCEELMAFGYDKDPLDGPKWLKPAILRHAKIRFEASKLVIGGSSGLTITGIVVFPARTSSETFVDRSAKPFKEAELRRAYLAYIDNLVRAGGHSNRENDVKAMKALFEGSVTHQAVYKLRQEYAPKEWQKSGRRKSGEK